MASPQGDVGDEDGKEFDAADELVLAPEEKKQYKTFRPHSSLTYLPPAPEAVEPTPFVKALEFASGLA